MVGGSHSFPASGEVERGRPKRETMAPVPSLLLLLALSSQSQRGRGGAARLELAEEGASICREGLGLAVGVVRIGGI